MLSHLQVQTETQFVDICRHLHKVRRACHTWQSCAIKLCSDELLLFLKVILQPFFFQSFQDIVGSWLECDWERRALRSESCTSAEQISRTIQRVSNNHVLTGPRPKSPCHCPEFDLHEQRRHHLKVTSINSIHCLLRPISGCFYNGLSVFLIE
jgi:hypothetical protein